ncbi:hypothetical protein FVE85_6715 [Porphyridium purpureum]|uniref:Uncharacterized protein n=1 Tax=Porphyridium purpureum TaxID=35688 RepID=A0A5J4Z7N4_PORPP|nr:hypothetical protein FVE85_6715 [Porphyridium purpureum]|eukprot:POR2653..scf295_1
MRRAKSAAALANSNTERRRRHSTGGQYMVNMTQEQLKDQIRFFDDQDLFSATYHHTTVNRGKISRREMLARQNEREMARRRSEKASNDQDNQEKPNPASLPCVCRSKEHPNPSCTHVHFDAVASTVIGFSRGVDVDYSQGGRKSVESAPELGKPISLRELDLSDDDASGSGVVDKLKNILHLGKSS